MTEIKTLWSLHDTEVRTGLSREVCPPPEQLDDDVTAILSALEPTAP